MRKPQAVKRQVFVSYAHADNKSMGEGSPGWVSSFVDKLKKSIAQRAGGSKVEIWMDHGLEPQRCVNDALHRAIRESAVLLAFMSPQYIESTWCRQEMAAFVKEVGKGKPDDRIFLVEILPTPRDSWHRAARNLSPVQLWSRNLPRLEAKPKGWPVPNPQGDQEYWNDINYLADVLAAQLATFGASGGEFAVARDAVGGTTLLSPVAPSAVDHVEPLVDGPLKIVIHAAPEEDPQLATAAQALLGELGVYGYMAPAPGDRQTPAQHRAAVMEQLQGSHAVLLVYGSAPPSWVQATHSEIGKVLAINRRGTWSGLIEGPPESKPPHGLPPLGLMVLDWRTGPNKRELGRFMQKLRRQRSR